MRQRLLSPRQLLLNATVAAAAITGVLSFVVAPLQGRFTGDQQDFDPVIAAGHQLGLHQSPYDAFISCASTHLVTNCPFDYPPVAGWLLQPFSHVSVGTARLVWLWMSLVATLAACQIIARVLLPASWPRVRLGLLMALVYLPTEYSLWHGNINGVILLVLAGALWCYVRDREVACGLLLALGASLKLAPIVLVVLFIRRRWWRGIAAAGAGVIALAGAAVAALGVADTRIYLTKVMPLLNRDDGWFFNQSWSAVVSRLVDHGVVRPEPTRPALHLTVLALSVLGLAVAAVSVHPRSGEPARRGLEFGLGVTAMLLAGTITWYAHYVHLLIPMAAAAGWLAADGRRAGLRSTRAALIVVLAVDVVLAPAVLSSESTRMSLLGVQGSVWWWPMLQAISLPALSVAALMTAFSVALLRERRGARLVRGSMAPAVVKAAETAPAA